jgi:hypothetical protein
MARITAWPQNRRLGVSRLRILARRERKREKFVALQARRGAVREKRAGHDVATIGEKYSEPRRL